MRFSADIILDRHLLSFTVGHNNRNYGKNPNKGIGTWISNDIGCTVFAAYRPSDSSRYDSQVYFEDSRYDGKTMKVYDSTNTNLIIAIKISGTGVYMSRNTYGSDIFGLKTVYYNGGDRIASFYIEFS